MARVPLDQVCVNDQRLGDAAQLLRRLADALDTHACRNGCRIQTDGLTRAVRDATATLDLTLWAIAERIEDRLAQLEQRLREIADLVHQASD